MYRISQWMRLPIIVQLFSLLAFRKFMEGPVEEIPNSFAGITVVNRVVHISTSTIYRLIIGFSLFWQSVMHAQSAPPELRSPGIVINHLAATNKAYIGSPSIAVMADGKYVVSHDFFGPGSTYDKTLVFESHDKGATWNQIAELKGQWWSTLFVHRADLYLLGTAREYGDVVIRRSSDGGKTWTEPKDSDSGLLLQGRYHCAPVPVMVHEGRLWRAMEDAMGEGGWGKMFRAFMMSAPENADLLKAESWKSSNRLARNPQWLNGDFNGWLEGNAVVLPNGEMADILRVASTNYPERAAIVRVSDDGAKASFNPRKDFIEFPGGAKKFTIRFDPKTKRYWSLVNHVPEQFRSTFPDRTRNTLALISSNDCRKWRVDSIVYQHPDTRTHGYQYVDWLFEGNDLVSVIRTAHDDELGGANNYHNSNYITFFRVKNFRKGR